MTPPELEEYLHAHIPISREMGVRVAACEGMGVTLAAPLAPNINHRATVFGGSASAVAILAAWATLHHAMTRAGSPARLVIQRNTVDYLLPIAGEFTARCEGLPEAKLAVFLKMLARHGRARVELTATLEFEGSVAARFSGEFVAIRTS